VAFGLAAIAVAIGVARWRRGGAQGGEPGATSAPREEDAERLEADLSRYDL